MKRLIVNLGFLGIIILTGQCGVQAQVFQDDFSSGDTSLYNLYHDAIYDAVNGNIRLTQASWNQAGRCYLDIPFPMDNFMVDFDFHIGGGSSADGMVFAFTENQNYSRQPGEWLDFQGAIGYGIVMNTYQNSGDPVHYYIGLVHNGPKNPLSYWPTTNQYLRNNWHNMMVQNASGHVKVWVDDTLRIDYQIANFIPYAGYFGFTAATYNANDFHRVDNFAIHYVAGMPSISLFPGFDSTSIGGWTNYILSVSNYDTVAIDFDVMLTGLDAGWYEIANSHFLLLSGQSKQDTIGIDVPSQPGIMGDYPFMVNTYISSIDSTIARIATLRVVNNPIIESVSPADNITTSSRDVGFSWYTSAICSTEVHIKPADSSAFTVYTGELARNHSVTVTGLSRNQDYDWYVRSAGEWGGVSVSAVRRIHIDNGVVFSRDLYRDTISRDYDQRLTVSIANTDTIYHSVWLEADNSYGDLAVNFIGDGSLDNQLLLNPNQTGEVTIAIHAQDATHHDYSIPIRLTSVEGTDTLADFSTLNVYVSTLFINAVFEEVSVDSGSLAKNYRFINYGDAVTDLNVTASESLNSHIYFEPQISHALLQTNDTLNFKAIPILMPEDTTMILRLKAEGKVVKFPSEELLTFSGVVSATFADTSISLDADFSPPEGETIWLAHLENLSQCFNRADWYCTNRPDIYIDYRIPPMAPPENAFFQMDLTPRSGWNQRPHSVYVYVNDHLIGSIENTIPSGTYNFAIDPDFMNFSPSQVSINRVHIHTTHMNGGHYVVSTNMSICLCMNSIDRYISAANQEQANERLLALIGVLPSNIAVNITEPSQGQSVNLGQPVLVRTTVYADGQEGVNIPVKASFSSGDNGLVLFDDGDHQDQSVNDGIYANTWNPAHQGACNVVVRAGDCSVYGADTVAVTVIGPDAIQLVIQSPEQDFHLIKGRATNLVTEVHDNFGNPVPGSEMTYARATIGCESDRTINLYDDGAHSDGQQNDGIYGAIWVPNPPEMGPCQVTFDASHPTLGNAQIDVSGEIDIPSIKVLDGDNENPQPIVERSCSISRIRENDDVDYLGTCQTDANGIIFPNPNWLTPGEDKVRLEVIADTLRTLRGGHSGVDDIAAIFYVDNDSIRETGPAGFNDIFQGVPGQEIKLRHTIIKFNLTVGVEWDASIQELQNLELAFRRLANYLYDITDGQATLGKVEIFDEGCSCCENSWKFDFADVKIKATAIMQGTAQSVPGIFGNHENGCTAGSVIMPRVVYVYDLEGNLALQLIYGIDWARRQIDWGGGSYFDSGVQSLAHELGHYLFYLADEYISDPPDWNFGLMDYLLRNSMGDDHYGEMSSLYDYGDDDQDHRRSTNQWRGRGGLSCWQFFELIYEGRTNDWVRNWLPEHCFENTQSPFKQILIPQERQVGNIPFTGPNNNIVEPDIDCGNLAQIVTNNYGWGDGLYKLLRVRANHEVIGDGIMIKSLCGVIDQGLANSSGEMLLVGSELGDEVISSQLWLNHSSGALSYDYGSLILSGSILTDSIELAMNTIAGDYPLALFAEASAPEFLEVRAEYLNQFPQNPSIELMGLNATYHSEQLGDIGGTYVSSSIFSDMTGYILINATDDSLRPFAIPIQYQWTIGDSAAALLSGRSIDNGCRIFLDSASQAFNAVLTSQYRYLMPASGLPDNSKPVSQLYSVSLFPHLEELPGTNSLMIVYDEVLSQGINPSLIRMFRWDSVLRTWDTIPGIIDSLRHSYTALIDKDGIFVISAQEGGCGYIPGDINDSGRANGVDVGYGVNYFKGFGPPPPVVCTDCPDVGQELFGAGDVNGNCMFNGVDISYFVNYLKGLGPDMAFCQACPPTGQTVPTIPAGEPTFRPIINRQDKYKTINPR